MPYSWFVLIIFAFAVFRLTRLLVYDKITRFIRAPFIDEIQVQEGDSLVTYTKIKGKGLQHWIGELLSCYWCTGVWATAFLLLCYYLMPKVTEPFLFLLAIAGIAACIETIIGKWTE
ncbi:DUF1360 domain-containing protein [Ectobacillus antri]|uniref:DUF1360 domain-containing protein n=1 Tax=Ectobacillus antri TaxID=2486280 RepID=A0ABT6H3Q3_9BACI|nr:DUF1360 domain-containing protein [Ectobacillus antri]MDG4656617.1 DUF1360 domain-containing protein [Ectobacillus antri]MDG5754020.1 DUF1360 domain-containing protein [Ectobacillus antri]